MNTAFISYYEHIAKLSRIANKQTLFLSHLLYRMEFDSELNQFVVSLTAYDKREILKSIKCDSKNPLVLASKYLNILTKAGLIKYIGHGAYMVCPKSYGNYKYIGKDLRYKNAMIYETRVFKESSSEVEEFYIITEDGERIEL